MYAGKGNFLPRVSLIVPPDLVFYFIPPFFAPYVMFGDRAVYPSETDISSETSGKILRSLQDPPCDRALNMQRAPLSEKVRMP